MKIFCKTMLIEDAPPLDEGTEITIRVPPEQLTWGMSAVILADGVSTAEIDNGDGTKTTQGSDKIYTHTYATPGIYRVHLPDHVRTITASYRTDNVYSSVYAPMILSARSVASKLTGFGISGFRNCRNMTDFDMRDCPVESVNTVFDGCTSLRSLAGLPRTLTTIKVNAFRGCAALNGRIDLPQVRAIDATAADKAPFQGCPGITELHFSDEAREALEANPLYNIAFGAENAVVTFG